MVVGVPIFYRQNGAQAITPIKNWFSSSCLPSCWMTRSPIIWLAPPSSNVMMTLTCASASACVLGLDRGQRLDVLRELLVLRLVMTLILMPEPQPISSNRPSWCPPVS
jgi:hypothetical protein